VEYELVAVIEPRRLREQSEERHVREDPPRELQVRERQSPDDRPRDHEGDRVGREKSEATDVVAAPRARGGLNALERQVG
jgi:hypothetical protein